MNVGSIAAVVLLATGIGFAENVVLEIPFPETPPDGVRAEADGSWTLTSSSENGTTTTLVRMDAPEITTERYAVTGDVRYEDVEGNAYLEMWSEFDDGSYFSRTIESQGPMRAMSGSSGWRSVSLVFDATGAEAAPKSLTINVVMPGRGEIAVGPLTLVELAPGEWPSGMNEGAGFGALGGVAGGVLGIVAGLLGTLGGMGKARRLVLTGFKVLIVLGLATFVAGMLSMARGQPVEVYYALFLLGGISVAVSASTLPRLTKRYEELELRKMSALDAR